MDPCARAPLVALPLVGLLLLALPASPLRAQETSDGQLVVTVTDASGAAIDDATVRLSRGADRRQSISRGGTARFDDLRVGTWTVTVSREGFVSHDQPVAVEPRLNEVSARLAVAGFSESIQVGGEAGAPTQAPLDVAASGGSRLDIPVRDLPASLFMVSQQLIQDRGARSVEEAVQLAVGMQASTGVGSIPGYATRGWSGNNISLLRDGVRQNSVSQSSRPVDPFLLERVEILKGPASLMFGEGAIGGAINLVSKSPLSEPSVDAVLAYGSYGQYRSGIGLNVPLRTNLFARVDASQSGSEGYVKDSPQKLAAAAASLRWLPTGNVSLKGSGLYTYDDTSAYYATPFVNGAFDPRMRRINYNMSDRLTKSHNRWLGLEGQALLGGWTFHNQLFVATHALDWRNFEGYAYNAALNVVEVSSYFLIWRSDLLVGNRATARTTTSVAGRTLSLVVGGEAQRNDLERAGNPTPNFLVPVRRLDPLNPQPHFDPGFTYQRQRDVLITTKALFAESVFDLTQRLKVVGEPRRDHGRASDVSQATAACS
jgi:iron complex outermembrane recepter protein